MKNDIKELAHLIDSGMPLIYILSSDYHYVDELIEHATENKIPLEYIFGVGEVKFKGKKLLGASQELSTNVFAPAKNPEAPLVFFLQEIYKGEEKNCFLLIKDAHAAFENPSVTSCLRNIALKAITSEYFNLTVFIVSSVLSIPRELEELITVFEPRLPDKEMIRDQIQLFGQEQKAFVTDDCEQMAPLFKGMTSLQIHLALSKAFNSTGRLEILQVNSIVQKQKKEIISKCGILELIDQENDNKGFGQVGGLKNLKEWLNSKRRIYADLENAKRKGVDSPKGALILGQPGCGKSLIIKAAAEEFKLPLIRLDVGRLMGKYLGESEANMRKALKIIENVSPCILWIDELEKAFAGVGSSGGGHEVTLRLFGSMLTWMQERTADVFILATANDIGALPSEFLRKGRFDELFWVDSPSCEECEEIYRVHLTKRKVNTSDLNLTKISHNLTGAEIEAVVKEAVEAAFLEGRKVNTVDLEKARAGIKSIQWCMDKDKQAEMKKNCKIA